MSDEEKSHWSDAIFSTHVFGVHVSILFPLICNLFAGLSFWVTFAWIVISVITHRTGFGFMGTLIRIRILIGKFVHGKSRIRKNKIKQVKKKMGLM